MYPPIFRAEIALVLSFCIQLPLVAAEDGGHQVPRLEISETSIPIPVGLSGGVEFIEGGDVLWAVDERGRIVRQSGNSWVDDGIVLGQGVAFAGTPTGLIALGGVKESGDFSSSVVRLEIQEGKVIPTELVPLPEGLSDASAVVLKDTLFLIGGRTAKGGVGSGTRMLTLNLADAAAGWMKGESLPGRARAKPALSSHNGSITVIGGVALDQEGTGEALVENWSYRQVPIEATSARGWKRLADLPSVFFRPVAAPLGQVQILVADTASAAPGDAPSGKNLMAYNIVTDAWTPFEAPGVSVLDGFGKSGQKFLLHPGGVSVLLEAKPEVTLRRFGWVDYGVIALYFVILGFIGSRFTKQESSEEFTLGNRKVKWWAAGISMFATSASAISFMAVPALAFSTNLVWFLPVLLLIPSYFITAYFIYPLLRRLNITSTYEYLEQRFNRTLRLLASGQCILLQTFGRGSVVLLLPALAISLITGIDVLWAVAIMGVCTLIYTVIGGFEAVIWTEVFQAVLMFMAPVVIIVTALVALPGGVGEFFETGASYAKFDIALPTWDVTVPALWIMLLSGFVTTVINPAGDQPVIQRVFSSPLAEVRKVNATSNVCGIVIGLLTQGMGLVLFAYFHRFPQQFVPESQIDQLVPLYVTQAMPVGFGGVIVAAIFAAAMSTVASATNSVATIYVEDFHPKSGKARTPEGQVRLLRFVSLLVGVIATVTALGLGLFNMKSLMIFWAQIMALLGGGFVGVYILGMFTKRTNGFGAVGGALMSIVVALVLKYFTSAHWALYFPAAALSCIAFGYFFSLFRPAPVLRPGLTVYHPVPDSESKAAV